MFEQQKQQISNMRLTYVFTIKKNIHKSSSSPGHVHTSSNQSHPYVVCRQNDGSGYADDIPPPVVSWKSKSKSPPNATLSQEVTH